MEIQREIRQLSSWIYLFSEIFFAAVLGWSLYHFGSVQHRFIFESFLLLLPPTLLLLWVVPYRTFKNSRLLILFLGGGLFLGLGALLNFRTVSPAYFVALVGWCALLVSTFSTSSSPLATKLMLFLLIALGSLEAGYGLFQSLAGYDYIGDYARAQGDIASGTFINPNHFAGLLNMTLPLALGAFYAVYARKGLGGVDRSELLAWSWVVLMSCSFFGLAVLLSVSRAGTFVLITTIGLVSILMAARRSSHHHARSQLGWGLLLAIGTLGLWVGMDRLVVRMSTASSDMPRRIVLYRDVLRMIQDEPLWGAGPGMFEWKFRRYQTTDPNVLFSYAHNDYLHAAAEWGLPLAVLAWLFIFWRFFRTVRIFVRSREPWTQGISLACAGSMFALLVHSLFDFNLQIPANLMFFSAVTGLSWGLDFRHSLGREAAGRSYD
ncbi:MAG: O-antigen ligase family protein [Acidobacteria bacterium]|nr:O-antigen ligase family protein [Acidobacteriota bacterium]